MLIIALFYFNIIKLPASITPLAESRMSFENGKVYLTSLVQYTGGNGSIKLIPQVYDFGNRTKVIPQKNVTVYFKQTTPAACQYGVRLSDDIELSKIVVVFGAFPVVVWTENTKLYELTGGRYDFPFDVYTTSSNILHFNGGDLTVNKQLIYDTDGKGILSVTETSYKSGARTCPSPTGAVLWFNKDGRPILTTKESYINAYNDAKSKCWLGDLDKQCIANNFNVALLREPQAFAGLTGNSMVDNKYNPSVYEIFVSPSEFGTAELVFYADQDFFNSYLYTVMPVGKPQIKQIVISPRVAEQSKVSGYAIVTNLGDSGAEFHYKFSGRTAASGSFTLNTNSDYVIPFSFDTASVSSDVTEQIALEVCSSDGVSITNCDRKSQSYTVVDTSTTPTTPVSKCGNGVCDAGETYLSCPVDNCPRPPIQTQQTCEVKGMIYNPTINDCDCPSGKVRQWDAQKQEFYCQEPLDITYIILILIVIGGAGIIFLTQKKKKR